MQCPESINKELPRPPRTLRVTMWVLFVLLLAGIYGPWLLQPFVSPWGLVVDFMELRLLLYLLYRPPSEAFYSSQTSFLVLWCVGLSACTLLWKVSQRGWIARAISFFPRSHYPMCDFQWATKSLECLTSLCLKRYIRANIRFWFLWCVGLSSHCFGVFLNEDWGARAISCLPLGILVIAPFVVFTLKYGSYNTLETFEAPQGYEVNWLTQPKSILAGAVRRAQFRLTIGGCVVDFCEPRLLGWSQDNQLYYFIADRHSYCSRDEGELWVYDPATGDEPRQIQRLPDGFESRSEVFGSPRSAEEEKQMAKDPNFVAMGPTWPLLFLYPWERIDQDSNFASLAEWQGQLTDEAVAPNGTMRAVVILDWDSYDSDVIILRRADQ